MIAYVALHAIIYFYYDKGLKISIRAQTPTNNKLRRLQEWNKLVIVLMVLVSHIHSFTCNRILWQVALWSVGHIEIKFDIDKIDLLWCSIVLQGFPKLTLLKVHHLM